MKKSIQKSILILMLSMMVFAPVFASAAYTDVAKSQGYHTPLHTQYIYSAIVGQDWISIGEPMLQIGTDSAGNLLYINRAGTGDYVFSTIASNSKIVLNTSLVEVTGNMKIASGAYVTSPGNFVIRLS